MINDLKERRGVVGTRSEVVSSRGYYRGSLLCANGLSALGVHPTTHNEVRHTVASIAGMNGGPVSPTEGPQQVQILPPLAPVFGRSD